jgi:protein-S-isoprenylcysteine O-methyltransferase Ste14
MSWRALIAFLALPGKIAIAMPASWLWYTGHRAPRLPAGLAVLLTGIVGLLRCVRDFYVVGRGTLAPWAPPKELVTVGLYRHSRNPMYLCVMLTLLGWSATYRSFGLLIYAVAVAIAFQHRVVFGEEPWLARVHGPVW